MIRLVFVGLLIGYSLGAAPASRPNKPDSAAMHQEAFELMQREKSAEARARLDAVYNATPARARSRALVLNHAIVDLARPAYAMRAVKDLTAYLGANPQEDELATNVLGSCLDVAAEKPAIAEGPLWKAGLAEWQKRNTALEESGRKHRWGTRWLDDKEFAELQGRIEAADQMIEGQGARVEEAYKRLDDAIVRRGWVNPVKFKPLLLAPKGPTRVVYHEEIVHKGPPRDYWWSGRVRGTSFSGGFLGMTEGGRGSFTIEVTDPPPQVTSLLPPPDKSPLDGAVRQAAYEYDVERERLYDLTRQRPYPVWPRLYPPVPPSAVMTRPVTLAPPPTSAPSNVSNRAVNP